AVSESLSETRTRGAMTASFVKSGNGVWAAEPAAGFRPAGSGRGLQRSLLLGESPVEPGHQLFEVGRLDRRAGPDAQPWGRIAVMADVIGHALLVQRRDDSLGELRLRFERESGDLRIDD